MKTSVSHVSDIPWKAAVFSACLALGACLAPEYKRPTVEPASAYKEIPTISTSTWRAARPLDGVPKGAWWEVFGDPRLDELEGRIETANPTLQEALAQFEQARSIVSQTRSAYGPTVTADPSADRARGYSGGTPPYNTNTDLIAPVSASWEPDFFGVIRLAVKQQAATAQASAASLENTRLVEEAELASDYFAAETLDMQEDLLSSATASYVENLELTKNRYASGVASQVDIVEAQAQLDGTRAQLTDLGVTRAQYENAIAVLIGRNPADFKLAHGRIAGPPPVVPMGVPSELLERRPDVAAAERQAASANAGIGLANAAYFPFVELTATGGWENGTLADWFLWPSRIWALGAQASETLLDWGKRKAEKQQAEAAYDEAVANYQQTALSAFQEVENDLSGLQLLEQEAQQQDSAVKAAESSLKLEMDRYLGGVDSYLSVIQVENIALTDENSAVQILGRRMNDAVDLVRALGGGWDASQLPTMRDMHTKKRAETALAKQAPAAEQNQPQ